MNDLMRALVEFGPDLWKATTDGGELLVLVAADFLR